MTRAFDPLNGPIEGLAPINLVNASAGTGKTWTVTHFASRWLLEGVDRKPSDILLVTFARDAAGELKSRLRERLLEFGTELERLARGAELVEPAQEWQRRFDAYCVGRVDLVRARYARVMSELDQLNARTIHSFATLLHPEGEQLAQDATEISRRAAREVVAEAARGDERALRSLFERIGKTSSALPSAKVIEVIVAALGVALPMGGLNDPAHSLVAFVPGEDDAEAAFLETLIRRAEERERSLRSRAHVVSYDALIGDLLLEVRRNPGALRRRLAGQFQLVLIDEFQDTDAAQWEIFTQLFRHGEHPTPMIVVGDAKQAIYGFRGGDVKVMQRLQRVALEDERVAVGDLAVNHRSHDALVRQLNEFYAVGASPHEFAPSDRDLASIVYEPVGSPDRLRDGLGLFTVRDLREMEGPVDAAALLRKDVLLELQRLVGDPSQLDPRERKSDGTAWQYSDVAILCRTRDALREVQRDLERVHVPVVTPRSVPVFTTLAAAELRLLLWAIAGADDPRRWRSLAMSWFAHLDTEGADAATLARALARSGAGALHRLVTGGAFLTSLLAYRGGQRHVTDIEHLFSVMADAFPNGANVLEALEWLEDAMRAADEGTDDGNDGQRRIDSDENAVRLMTVHASKGLQFPIVLIPKLETAGTSPALVTRTDVGGRLIDAASALRESKERSSAMRLETSRENDRLIYVALTRAEQILTTWLSPSSPKNEPGWTALVDRADQAGVGPIIRRVATPELVSADVAVAARNVEHLSPVEVRTVRRDRNEPLRRWSYSALHAAAAPEDASGASAASTEDEDASLVETTRDRRGYYAFGPLRGNRLGDALHASFEHVVGLVAADDEGGLRTILEREFTRQGLPFDPALVGVMQRLLRASLGPALDGACLDAYAGASVAVAAEMRFTLPLVPRSGEAVLDALGTLVRRHDETGPFTDYFCGLRDHGDSQLGEGYLTGSIDLVLPTLASPTRYVVVDYKSNALTSTSTFSPADLREEMRSSGYPLQALLYSVALHRHLRSRRRDYDPATHLGGALYYYLRGAALEDAAPGDGIFHWAVPPSLTLAVSALLGGVQ